MRCQVGLGIVFCLCVPTLLMAEEIRPGSLVVVIQDKVTLREANRVEVPVAVGEVFRVVEMQDNRWQVEPFECLPGNDLPPILLAFRTRRLMQYFDKHLGSVDRGGLRPAEDALSQWNEAIRNTPSAEAYHRRAKLHLALGELQNARKDIDEALRLAPEHLGIHWTSYQQHLQSKSYEPALEELYAILKLQPKNEVAMASRAALFHRMGNTTRAEEAFDEALRQHPQGILARLEKAYFHELQEDWDEASQMYQEISKLQPDDSTALLLQAIPSWKKNGPFDAIQRCTEALLVEPGLLPAHMMRGYLRRIIKDWNGVAADSSEVIAQHPTESVAYSERAYAYYRLQRNGEAIADYDQALKLNPKTERGHYYRGLCYYSLKQYEQAGEDFSQQIDLTPNDPDVWHERALTRIAMSQFEPAMQDLDRTIVLNPKHAAAFSNRAMLWLARDNTDQALVNINAALVIKPVDAFSFNKRGEIYWRRGETQRAMTDFTTALKVDPKFSVALLNRGRVYLALRNYPAALADFDRMEKLNPASYLPALNRARVHIARQEKQQAILEFEAALRLAPDQADVFDIRSQFWMSHQEWDKQLDDLNRCIELGHESAYFYTERGNVWKHKQDYKKAIADLQHAISLDRQYVLAYARLALVYEDLKQFDQAISAMDTALGLNPNFTWGWNIRGWQKYCRKDYDAAIADFDKALQQDPKYVRALTNRGMCWKEKKQYEKAMADFDAAILLGIQDTDARFHRSGVHTLLGRYDWARDDYNIMIETLPRSPVGWNGRAWLLATCPEASIRNGRQAIEDAQRASELSAWKDPNILDTLAAAYAEAGDFAKAVEWQNKAVDLAPEAEKGSYGERLKLYRQGIRYRESSPNHPVPELPTVP